VPALLPFDGATLARLATAGALPFLPAAAFVRLQPSSVGAGFEVAPLLSPAARPADASAWNNNASPAATSSVAPSVDENQNSKQRRVHSDVTVTSHVPAGAVSRGLPPHTADQNLIVLALAAAAQHRKELDEARLGVGLQHHDYSQDTGSIADDDSDDGDCVGGTGSPHTAQNSRFTTSPRHHPRVRSMIAGMRVLVAIITAF